MSFKKPFLSIVRQIYIIGLLADTWVSIVKIVIGIYSLVWVKKEDFINLMYDLW